MPPPFGLFNINKPSGPTSHDIVASIRRGLGERRVGHAGTLDPLAAGVLVVAVGRATRLVEYLTQSDKEYIARLRLGVTTNTYDADGTIVSEHPLPSDLTRSSVDTALDAFRGEIEQIPPVYSAVKIRGKAAHRRARNGETIDLPFRRVMIHALDLVAFSPPELQLRVVCSAGTYVRSIVHELGQLLGCGAMLSELTRIASGRFRLEQAVAWNTLEEAFDSEDWEQYLLPPDLALADAPSVRLNAVGQRRICNGMEHPAMNVQTGLARAYAPDGRFIAVLSGDPDAGVWRPKKVFI